jgi:hypothetical protein
MRLRADFFTEAAPLLQRYASSTIDVCMKSRLKRKAFFVQESALRRAKRILGVATDAEAVRRSIEVVAEMETFWRFLARSRGSLGRRHFDVP